MPTDELGLPGQPLGEIVGLVRRERVVNDDCRCLYGGYTGSEVAKSLGWKNIFRIERRHKFDCIHDTIANGSGKRPNFAYVRYLGWIDALNDERRG